jgi:hypothetical protein
MLLRMRNQIIISSTYWQSKKGSPDFPTTASGINNLMFLDNLCKLRGLFSWKEVAAALSRVQ